MDKKFVIKKELIHSNINEIKKTVGDKKIYAVLKGNAYGMGLLPFANEVINAGLKDFAVTDLGDAILLKQNFPDCDVLLLTPCHILSDIDLAIENDIILAVDSLENAQNISASSIKQNKKATVQIKIDSGMGRYGFLPNQLDDIEKACGLDGVLVEGIFSHLHSAFNKSDKPSKKQFELFCSVINELEARNITFKYKHIANSIAIFRFKDMQLNAVRAGSALIGRVNAISGAKNLCKVGELYGEVVDIRALPKGHNIGYAALYKTKSHQKIVCVNAGYADGVAVSKANDTFRFFDILRYAYNDFKLILKPTPLICKINGKNARSLGRIGMTNLVLDASNLEEVKIGDSVEIPVNPIYLSPLIKREYI